MEILIFSALFRENNLNEKLWNSEKSGTISIIKLIERLKTQCILSELIFADFADFD